MIPRTSVGIERVFNSAQDICHYHHGWMKPDMISEQMLLLCFHRGKLEAAAWLWDESESEEEDTSEDSSSEDSSSEDSETEVDEEDGAYMNLGENDKEDDNIRGLPVQTPIRTSVSLGKCHVEDMAPNSRGAAPNSLMVVFHRKRVHEIEL